ncbi:MAG: hypothetical protein ACREH5_03780, partial [Candidatus Omnitrophota bacterium]
LWRIAPPYQTFLRSVLISAGIYAVAVVWPAQGLWLFVKFFVLSAAAAVSFLITGELDREEREILLSLLPVLKGGAERRAEPETAAVACEEKHGE